MGYHEVFVRRGAKIAGPTTWPKLRAAYESNKLKPGDEAGPSRDGPWKLVVELLACVGESPSSSSPSPLPPEAAAPLAAVTAPEAPVEPGARTSVAKSSASGPRRIAGATLALALVAVAAVKLAGLAGPRPLGAPAPNAAIAQPPGPPPNRNPGPDDAIAARPPNEAKPVAQPGQAAPPPPRSGPPIPQEYRDFARIITELYTLEPETRPDRGAIKYAETTPSLEKIAESKFEPIRESAKVYLQAQVDFLARTRSVSERLAASRSQVGGAIRGSLRGDFTSQHEVAYRTASGDLMFESQTVDGSGGAILSSVLSSLVERGMARKALQEAIAGFDRARFDAWSSLEPHMQAIYAGRSLYPNAVVVDLVAPDDADGSPGAFLMRHRSPRDLHHVTIIMRSVHFSGAPEVSEYRLLYLPEWRAGQVLAPVGFMFNQSTTEMREGRPREASLGVANPWLFKQGGVVSVEITAWADEGRQPAQVITFPGPAREGAAWELDSLGRLMESDLARKLKKDPNHQLTELPASPTRWAERALRRVELLAPTDDPSRRAAALARENPAAFLADYRRRLRDRFARHMDPKIIYRLDVTPITDNKFPTIDPVAGAVGLRFIDADFDTNRVTAVVFRPDDPTDHRRLPGTIENAVFSLPKLVFNFAKPPGGRTSQKPEVNLLSGGGRLSLVMRRDGWFGDLAVSERLRYELLGIAMTGDQQAQAARVLGSTLPTAAELANLKEALQVGSKREGDWKSVSEEDLSRTPPFNQHPELFAKSGLPKGRFTLTVESLDLEAGKCQVRIIAPVTASPPPPESRLARRIQEQALTRNRPGTRDTANWNGTLLQDPVSREWTLQLQTPRTSQAFSSLQLNPEWSNGSIRLAVHGKQLRGRLEAPGAQNKIWVELETRN